MEPFIKALEAGADVILGGRATDPAVFAGPPMVAGIPTGIAWHGARTMDKGVMMTVPGEETGSLGFVQFREDHFIASSTKEGTYCTPRSVAAVTLYENNHPYQTTMPSGVIDTEGCTLRGHRRREGQGVRCPVPSRREVHRQAGRGPQSGLQGPRVSSPFEIRCSSRTISTSGWPACEVNAERNLHLQGVEPDEYTVRFRIYGKNGVMGDDEPILETKSHELAILVDAIGKTQEAANEAAARHKALAGHTRFRGQLNHNNVASHSQWAPFRWARSTTGAFGTLSRWTRGRSGKTFSGRDRRRVGIRVSRSFVMHAFTLVRSATTDPLPPPLPLGMVESRAVGPLCLTF